MTGEDLNWFFNQWYFNQGHPVLDITYGYDAEQDRQRLGLSSWDPESMPAVFELPVLLISIFPTVSLSVIRFGLIQRSQVLPSTYQEKPRLINFDADRIAGRNQGQQN